MFPKEARAGRPLGLSARPSSDLPLLLSLVERQEWMQALQQAVAEQRARARPAGASLLGVRGSEQPDHAGSLELRGFKNKLYVTVVGDKVQLYKNLEVRRLGQATEAPLPHVWSLSLPLARLGPEPCICSSAFPALSPGFCLPSSCL